MNLQELSISKKRLAELAIASIVAVLSLFGTVRVEIHMFESPCHSIR